MLALLILMAVLVVGGIVTIVVGPIDGGFRWWNSPVGRGVLLVIIVGAFVAAGWQYAAARALVRRSRIRHPEALPFPTGATTRQVADLLAAWLGQRPSIFGRLPVIVAVNDGLEVWWRLPDRPELEIPWRGTTVRAAGRSELTGKRGNYIMLGVPGLPVPLELPVGARKVQALRLWRAVTSGADTAALREQQRGWDGIR